MRPPRALPTRRSATVSGGGLRGAPGAPEDCDGHGTAVAGLISGRTAGDDRVPGAAPDARILPMRFEGDIGQAAPETIAAAIRAAADRAQVMNLSFAVARDHPAIRDAVRYAVERDVVVVAAADNENAGRRDPRAASAGGRAAARPLPPPPRWG